jgi:uncharacterized membrane protein
MKQALRSIQAGWRDARWSLYFGVVLFPLTMLAGLLAFAIEGRPGAAPSTLSWVLIAVATLVSLYVAGLWDGPDGRLGQAVWALTVVTVAMWLVRRASRQPGQEQSVTLKFGRHEIALTLTARVGRTADESIIRYGDVASIWRAVGRGSGRGVLIGV